MWKKLVVQKKSFLFKISSENHRYEIMLSDLKKLWIESLSEKDIICRWKMHNPLFEAESDVIFSKIKEMTDPEKTNVNREITTNSCGETIIKFNYTNEFLFSYEFILTEKSPEMVFQHLTFPLLQVIEELQSRETILKDLLMKKDREINEYKIEGYKISRKTVITEPFDKDTFLKSTVSSPEAAERSIENLMCPIRYFENSITHILEDCTQRNNFKEDCSSKKDDEPKINHKESLETKEKLRKRKNELEFDATEDDDNIMDDDETYFSIKKEDIKAKTNHKTRKFNI